MWFCKDKLYQGLVVALRVRTVPNVAIAIHVPTLCRWKDVDGRDKPGHDEKGLLRIVSNRTQTPRTSGAVRATAHRLEINRTPLLQARA
jgi:hypothetical protein